MRYKFVPVWTRWFSTVCERSEVVEFEIGSAKSSVQQASFSPAPVSEAWMTPRSLTPKAEMTPPWREWLPYDRDDALPQNWLAAIFRITRCLNFQQICRPTCLSIQMSRDSREDGEQKVSNSISSLRSVAGSPIRILTRSCSQNNANAASPLETEPLPASSLSTTAQTRLVYRARPILSRARELV